jgi:hypothetical protein
LVKSLIGLCSVAAAVAVGWNIGTAGAQTSSAPLPAAQLYAKDAAPVPGETFGQCVNRFGAIERAATKIYIETKSTTVALDPVWIWYTQDFTPWYVKAIKSCAVLLAVAPAGTPALAGTPSGGPTNPNGDTSLPVNISKAAGKGAGLPIGLIAAGAGFAVLGASGIAYWLRQKAGKAALTGVGYGLQAVGTTGIALGAATLQPEVAVPAAGFNTVGGALTTAAGLVDPANDYLNKVGGALVGAGGQLMGDPGLEDAGDKIAAESQRDLEAANYHVDTLVAEGAKAGVGKVLGTAVAAQTEWKVGEAAADGLKSATEAIVSAVGDVVQHAVEGHPSTPTDPGPPTTFEIGATKFQAPDGTVVDGPDTP